MSTPNSQIVWAHYCDTDGRERYRVTSNAARTQYFLYEAKNGEHVKIRTGKTPESFRDVIRRI